MRGRENVYLRERRGRVMTMREKGRGSGEKGRRRKKDRGQVDGEE